mmetsp:Transcript_19382/g.34521  ORF Transcript_19382/g.34521 Transcript_19382/m.34521 type:complete len:1118 (-) Transcript_19382:49-3402(-)
MAAGAKAGVDKGEEKGEQGSSPGGSWMGSWTKKTLAQAARAQRDLGELLARPGRKYRELSAENERLRRRAEELAQHVLNKELRVTGKGLVGALHAVKGGGLGTEGAVVGVDIDSKLVTIQWLRKRAGQQEPWQVIQGACEGYYRASVDDVGCVLRVDLATTEFYRRLTAELYAEQPGQAPKPSAEEDDAASIASNATSSTKSLSSMPEAPRLPPLPNVLSACTIDQITVSEHMAAALKRYSPQKESVLFDVKLLDFFSQRAQLKIQKPASDQLVVALSLKDKKKEKPAMAEEKSKERTSAGTAGKTNGGETKATLGEPLEKRELASNKRESGQGDGDGDGNQTEEGTEDEESEEEADWTSVQVDLPTQVMKVAPSTILETGFTISFGDRKERLQANSNLERDMIVVFLRQERAKVCKTPVVDTEPQPEFPPTEKAANASIGEGTSFQVAADCAYPEVWEALDYSVSDLKKGRRGSTVFAPNVLKSMSTLLSSALDPLNGESHAPNEALSKKQPPPDPDSPAVFNLYQAAGFGKFYTVELDLKQKEGLGMTLSLFNVLHHKKKNNQKEAINWPEVAPTCVCVSGFVPIELNGLSCKGQLEKSGLIRPGDALVKIGDDSIEEHEIATVKDLSEYVPCSLQRVAGLVAKGRSPVIPEEGAPAWKVVFTFAQGGTGHVEHIVAQNNLKARLESVQKKLTTVESNATIKIRQARRELRKQAARVSKMASVLEEHRIEAERAENERVLVATERAALQEQLDKERAAHAATAEDLASANENIKAAEAALEADKAEANEKIRKLEAAIQDVTFDGEAWTNTIATKEDALRAVERDLKAMELKNENLQGLIDSTKGEREQSKAIIAEKTKQVEEFTAQVATLEAKLEQADSDADALTSKMRQAQEESETQLARAQHELQLAQEKIKQLQSELAVAKSHTQALKDANASSEARAEESSRLRQQAEASLSEEKATVNALNERITQLQDRLRNGPAVPAPRPNNSSSSPQNDEEATKRVSELEGANEVLRAQVKSLKARVQGLAAEASKASQFDSVLAEKNELLVHVQVEKAQRQEAEDELSAYQRALRQMAEQIRKCEEQGVSKEEAWSNRPAIFDHLYKRLLNSDKS